MRITGLHHVGIPVRDMATAERFYVGVLGLAPCPGKPNWLHAGDRYSVHLMPWWAPPLPRGPARHLTLSVERLEDAAAHLLAHGLRPYQLTVDQAHRHDVAAGDPLDFGIGTLFVEDPDGNTVEFLEPGRGIDREILG